MFRDLEGLWAAVIVVFVMPLLMVTVMVGLSRCTDRVVEIEPATEPTWEERAHALAETIIQEDSLRKAQEALERDSHIFEDRIDGVWYHCMYSKGFPTTIDSLRGHLNIHVRDDYTSIWPLEKTIPLRDAVGEKMWCSPITMW